MKRIIAGLFMAALAGCVTPIQQWADASLPLAEQGKMKWSEYYTRLFNEGLKSNISNKGPFLDRVNTMIQISLAYESGRISRQDFDSATRLNQAAQAVDDQSEQMRTAAIWAGAMQNVSNAYKQAAPVPVFTPLPVSTQVQTNCTTYGGQMNCTSR